jgi:opacity protein-like surface antigen
MARRFLPYIIISLFLLPATIDAQRWKLRRYEGLFGVGFVNYFGDVGGSAERENWFGIKDLSLKHTRPSFYIGARYKIRSNVSVKMNLMYGFLSGNDEGSVNNDRGFEFSTSLFEPSIQGEYSLISEEQRRRSSALFNKKGMMNNYSQINLYLYAGIGGVFFNPKVNEAMKNSPNYDPGHSTTGVVFPAGLGLKYVINQRWSLGAEFGIRFTTTDYLDGYTSPFSKRNDLYYFGHVHGIYRIRTSKEGYPILFRRGRMPYNL